MGGKRNSGGMGCALAKMAFGRDVQRASEELEALADMVERGEARGLVVALVTRNGYRIEKMLNPADRRATMSLAGILARTSNRAVMVAEDGPETAP